MSLTGNKRKSPVSGEEQDKVSRAVLQCLNRYPQKPVDKIEFESLDSDEPGMALSVIQGAYKVEEYINGSYLAEYQFKIIYRLQPDGTDGRLKADEILNRMADWLTQQTETIDLGQGKTVKGLVCNSRSSLFGRYQDMSEDHQILMSMTYEVQ